MTFKEQLKKLKENWLLATVVLVLLLVSLLFGSFSGNSSIRSLSSYAGGYAMGEPETAMLKSASYDGGYYPNSYYPSSSDFAPEEENRLLTKTSWLSSEIARGQFLDADSKLKAIVKSTDSFLLNENVNRYGEGRTGNYYGSYQIKVETDKYSSIISQLKELGKVQSFNENTEDITGRYTDLKTEIEKEEERLKRYQQMYSEATLVADKIQLSDLIFNQERTIEYLKEYLNNLDNQVDYSTISVTLNEKQSGYVAVTLVKLSELIQKLVNSFNSLLALLFWILPWAIIVLVVWLGVRFTKKRK